MPLEQPRAVIDSPRMGTLTDVPEDQPLTPSARSPYFHHAVTGSATTFKPATSTTSLSSSGAGGSTPARTPSSASQRTPSGLTARAGQQPRSASGDAPSGMATPRNQRSGSPATAKEKDGDRDRDKDKDRDGGDKDEKREKRERGSERAERKGGKNQPPLAYRLRNTPHLPHAKDVELAPATLMHWSRAPVYGAMPLHGMRAHSVTLIDSIAWLFGGCDEKGCWKDVFCFNTGALLFLAECGHPCFRGGRTRSRMTDRVGIRGVWHDGHSSYSPSVGVLPVRPCALCAHV